MDKESALDRIKAIEKEASELHEIIKNSDKPKCIMERVKTFEDACHILGINPNNVTHSMDTKDEKAYKKLKVIARVLNEGWEPKINDNSQYKYYPYFNVENGGFVFYGYTYCSDVSGLPLRLSLKDRKLAEYCGKQFIELYKDLNG